MVMVTYIFLRPIYIYFFFLLTVESVSASVGRLSDFGLNSGKRGASWYNKTNCGVNTGDSVRLLFKYRTEYRSIWSW